MSSDKPLTTIAPKQGQETLSQASSFVSPNNIDYSILKSYYQNSNFPHQNFVNYPPVDLQFQQTQNFQSTNCTNLGNQLSQPDPRNIYYSNFTSQSNSTINVNPPRQDPVPQNKGSNFSSYPPQSNFPSTTENTNNISQTSGFSNQSSSYPNKEKQDKREYSRSGQNDSGSGNYYNRNSSFNTNTSGFHQGFQAQNQSTQGYYRNNPEKSGSYSNSHHNREEPKLDWICPVKTCRNRNFAKRDKCNLCKTEKPTNPEYDSSEFPKKKKRENSKSKSRSRSGKRDFKVREKDKERDDKYRDRDDDRYRSRDNDRFKERERDKERDRR